MSDDQPQSIETKWNAFAEELFRRHKSRLHCFFDDNHLPVNGTAFTLGSGGKVTPGSKKRRRRFVCCTCKKSCGVHKMARDGIRQLQKWDNAHATNFVALLRGHSDRFSDLIDELMGLNPVAHLAPVPAPPPPPPPPSPPPPAPPAPPPPPPPPRAALTPPAAPSPAPSSSTTSASASASIVISAPATAPPATDGSATPVLAVVPGPAPSASTSSVPRTPRLQPTVPHPQPTVILKRVRDPTPTGATPIAKRSHTEVDLTLPPPAFPDIASSDYEYILSHE